MPPNRLGRSELSPPPGPSACCYGVYWNFWYSLKSKSPPYSSPPTPANQAPPRPLHCAGRAQGSGPCPRSWLGWCRRRGTSGDRRGSLSPPPPCSRALRCAHHGPIALFPPLPAPVASLPGPGGIERLLLFALPASAGGAGGSAPVRAAASHTHTSHRSRNPPASALLSAQGGGLRPPFLFGAWFLAGAGARVRASADAHAGQWLNQRLGQQHRRG